MTAEEFVQGHRRGILQGNESLQGAGSAVGKVLTAREAASGFVAGFPTALQGRCLFSVPSNIPTPFPPSINLGYWFFLASQAMLLVLAGSVGTINPDHRNRS